MKKGILFKLINVIAVLALFAGSFFIGNTIAGIGDKEDEPVKIAVGDDKDTGMPVDRLNVLLLGIDARKGEEDARSDTMVLVSVDKETNKIAMLSIPRDTFVDIPGYGKSKINTANAVGGSELAVDVVEDLLDVEIPYYVKTNFEGFEDIVDTLGGVTIDVEKRMYYPDGKRTINLKKGVQRLDGAKALQYVRYRHDALGDITRTERQQKFLSALADETLQAKTIIKLPKLLPQFFDVVETNFRVRDAFFLTKVASSMEADNIVAQTLPGTFYNYKGISYWKANEEKTKLVLEDMFKGVTTAAVIDQPINVPKEQPKEEVEPGENEAQPETGTEQNYGSDQTPIDVNIETGQTENPQEGSWPDGIGTGQPPVGPSNSGDTGNPGGVKPPGDTEQGTTTNPENDTEPVNNGGNGSTTPVEEETSGVSQDTSTGTTPAAPTETTAPNQPGAVRSSTTGQQSQAVVSPEEPAAGKV